MDDLKNISVLVTGGGAPGAAGIIQALRKGGIGRILSCDIRQDVVGKVLADDFFTVPPGDHPAFIPHLLTACREKGVQVVLPITTRELIPLSEQKELFSAEAISVAVSPAQSLRIANDKGKLYQHLSEAGVEVPDFKIVSSSLGLETAVQYFEAKGQPFTIKPCLANGSRGFRVINRKSDPWERFINEKPQQTDLSSNELLQLFKGKSQFQPFLLAEYLPGPEFSVDCMLSPSEQLIVPRERLKMNNGISVEGLITQNQQVINYTQQILDRFELSYAVGIQVKEREDGQPLLLEINPRLQGSSVACLGAGLNLPLLAVLLCLGKVSLHDAQRIMRWEVHFTRYYKEAFLS